MEKKILVITPKFCLSGVALAQIRLARALSEEDHDVTLIIGNNNEGLSLPNLPNVKLVLLGHSRVIFMFFSLVRYLLNAKPEFIFSAEDHLNCVVTMAAILTRSDSVICASSRVTPFDTYSNIPFTKRWVLKYISRAVQFRIDLLTCVSKDMVGQYKTIFSSCRHTYVYNIVIDSLSSTLKKKEINHPWLNNKQRPVFIAAGMLEPWKGFDVLLEAFAKLNQRIDAHLIILGDGSLRQPLLNLAKSLGISKQIDLPGYTYNPLAYFYRADVFVLSSRVEGMPNVLIEAMSCGCTPVSTDCNTGPSEILINERYGYLCPVDDSDKMALQLEQAITNPIRPELLDQATRDFTTFNVLKRYGDLLSTNLIK